MKETKKKAKIFSVVVSFTYWVRLMTKNWGFYARDYSQDVAGSKSKSFYGAFSTVLGAKNTRK